MSMYEMFITVMFKVKLGVNQWSGLAIFRLEFSKYSYEFAWLTSASKPWPVQVSWTAPCESQISGKAKGLLNRIHPKL